MIPTIDLAPGLTVSRIGFGGMALTPVYGGMPEADAERTLNEVIDAGITFVDTADVYGDNEDLVGRVLATRRDDVQLATKFGINAPVGSQPAPGEKAVRGDRDYVRSACESSLRRLGIDVIDLYYMHRRDLEIPIEETVGAMAELVAEGKVRHLGLSEVTGSELRAAAAVHPIAAVQSEWSIWSRDVERAVVPAAAQLGVGFVPYSPLGRGFLTGTLSKADLESSLRKGQERYDQGFDANQAVLAVIAGVADELGATSAQVVLAWLYAQGERFGLPVVPIPGSRKSSRMVENAGALDLVLSDDQLQRLDGVAEQVVGERNIRTGDKTWISSGRE